MREPTRNSVGCFKSGFFSAVDDVRSAAVSRLTLPVIRHVCRCTNGYSRQTATRINGTGNKFLFKGAIKVLDLFLGVETKVADEFRRKQIGGCELWLVLMYSICW